MTREEAWAVVHEALPGPLARRTADVRSGRHLWSVTARSASRGRGRPPVTVSGTGETEVDALRDLDDRLWGVPKPDGGRMDELRRRARLAYVQGAQEAWPDMTADELERVIDRAP